jgi:hypothetical protein
MRERVPLPAEEFERALVDAAAFETVPQGSRERVALGLGLSPSGPPADAGLPGPRPASVGAEPGRALFRAVSRAVSRAGAKAAFFGVIGGLLVGGSMSVDMLRDSTRQAATVASSAVEPNAAVRAAAPESAPIAGAVAASASTEQLPTRHAPAASAPPVLDARAVVPARSATPSRPTRARRSVETAALAPGGPSSVASGDLLAEVKQLDEVRRRLQSGQVAGALRALDAFEQAFPRGELSLEARVLKVESLFGAARPEEARALARAILAAPSSERYRVELERLLESRR